MCPRAGDGFQRARSFFIEAAPSADGMVAGSRIGGRSRLYSGIAPSTVSVPSTFPVAKIPPQSRYLILGPLSGSPFPAYGQPFKITVG